MYAALCSRHKTVLFTRSLSIYEFIIASDVANGRDHDLRMIKLLQTLIPCLANFDTFAPFRVEDLVSADAPARAWIENRVYDVSAPGLVIALIVSKQGKGAYLHGVATRWEHSQHRSYARRHSCRNTRPPAAWPPATNADPFA